MKQICHILVAMELLCFAIFASCTNGKESKSSVGNTHVTNYVHDTIRIGSMPNGNFVYNLPCKVVNIHQEKEGKSLLFIWLHGGVHDRKMHDLFEVNHLDCCAADDSVLNYLQEKNIKAIALFPICHKVERGNCVTWRECYEDVMRMIRDYVDKGLVDSNRIFLAGSSDGGVGTWEFLQMSEHIFAAAMPMSCGNPRRVTIPVYFFNTQAEPDCTNMVNALNHQGSTIEYKHSLAKWHGRDDTECTHEFLDKFFSNVRK